MLYFSDSSMTEQKMNIDHLVFAAHDLEAGVAWMEQQLGMPPAAYGQHALMGTHNALWSLGSCYLEVIAIQPGVSVPRARWFGLDTSDIQQRLTRGVQFLTWQVRVTDVEACAKASAHDLGQPLRVTRDDLHWRLTVRADGTMPGDGAIPVHLEWGQGVPTPETTLRDDGLRLSALTVGTAGIGAALTELGVAHLVTTDAETTDLSAVIQTATGPVTLRSD